MNLTFISKLNRIGYQIGNELQYAILILVNHQAVILIIQSQCHPFLHTTFMDFINITAHLT